MISRTPIALAAAMSFALAGCGSRDGNSTGTDSSATVEANLDAENFDNVITSDEAVLNEAETRQLNVGTE